MKTLKNFVQLMGNLGQDVELREFNGGSKKANFTLATNESYNDKNGEKVEKTQWHNIVAWGKAAEWMKENLKKGDQVLILGQINYRKYEDKEGIARYITEINANEFIRINGK